MVVVLLMAIGAVFVSSAGVNLSVDLDVKNFYNFPGLRQIVFFPISIVVIWLVSNVNYRRLSFGDSIFKSPLFFVLMLSIGFLVLTLIPSIGIEKNYARRWLEIPGVGIRFQPSELAKWSMIFFVAAYCDKYGEEIGLFKKRFLPIVMLTGFVAGLIVIEDFGTAAFVSLLCFMILIIAGAKIWQILLPVPFGLAGVIFAIKTSPARIQRLAAFLDPEKWADSAAYQANQSLIAIGTGGLWGKGLGHGICKYGHLPEDTTDFIFAIICEEMGFVGAVGVILLFIIFAWLGMLVVMRAKDRFGMLLGAAIVLAISIQAALNIGVVTVVLPTKGIPLPFVSSGGTSMLMSAAAAGILLNIAKKPAEPDNNGDLS
ncbi:MAG TPA: putative peptidoglycan glycosyltransferase FtsW [Sedimentisphaerales bacterium]|nr:putative peptidoglycan glycosyltransferase FtsW [Sedimentisphaerales bacterium]